MPKLGNPLVYNLLDVADGLASLPGTRNVRKAAMRRAVSTAYYAVFHALCYVCTDELVGWTKTGTHDPIYRSVDHGSAKSRLAGKHAARIGTVILDIGAAVAKLQDDRHSADYAPPALTVSLEATLVIIALAKETVALIEGLDKPQRLELAILLIAKPRQA
ncbi:hypothetical protein G3T14_20300 [Methylobacterium sp. BTF04]|uniref:hypothetical protein n=1 Tax=Methylobacterium sp. BTF04 TaxID=2708300 RepID=UPI0013D5E0B1|nr:hypothetical protein [Methylobacterium sp. BTF04]NEU14448.1 hypothetical protein [Methylobacterium sp. BTF04]